MVTRTGQLLIEKVTLVQKNPYGPDKAFSAPAGSPIEWTGATNEAHRESYGGELLHWINVVGYETIGARFGIDFEWTDGL